MRIRCKECGDILISTGQLVICQCGKVGLDQTSEYIRIIGESKDWETLE